MLEPSRLARWILSLYPRRPSTSSVPLQFNGKSQVHQQEKDKTKEVVCSLIPSSLRLKLSCLSN